LRDLDWDRERELESDEFDRLFLERERDRERDFEESDEAIRLATVFVMAVVGKPPAVLAPEMLFSFIMSLSSHSIKVAAFSSKNISK
jgi:hypothetical protein